jgi:hypothetical protein
MYSLGKDVRRASWEVSRLGKYRKGQEWLRRPVGEKG